MVKKGGKKNRKFGRGSRSPSMKAYVATNRLEINRKKRIAKDAKAKAKARAKRKEETAMA